MKRSCFVFLLLLCATIPSPARPRRHHSNAQFDHYLLALSWSPEYCHSHSGGPQCDGSKPFSFVVHGLWPEYNSGGGPQNCGNGPGPSNPSQYLDIMPDLGLIQHEWTTHGTCTGLNADSYFALIRKAYNGIRIPHDLAILSTQLTESPQAVKKDFESANGNLPDSSLTVSCPSNYLQGVDVCLSKALSPIACPAPRDCRAQTIRILPLK